MPEKRPARLPDPTLLRPEAEEDRVAALVTRLRSEQNLTLAVLAGLAASVSCAALWAAITVITNYQIGFMAVGVGFAVGLAVRVAGKGVDPAFGLAGAFLSLLGCGLGNLLSAASTYLPSPDATYWDSLRQLTPGAALEYLRGWTQPIDFLFYALAIYIGYKYAFRQLATEEIETLI